MVTTYDIVGAGAAAMYDKRRPEDVKWHNIGGRTEAWGTAAWVGFKRGYSRTGWEKLRKSLDCGVCIKSRPFYVNV